MLSGMHLHPTRVCQGCEERLLDAFEAMRRHLNEMRTALDLTRDDKLTDEQRRLFEADLLETLDQAQSAWDAYRKHLSQHGLLPAS